VPELGDEEYRQFQELLDREAIREVIFTYCRGIDRVDEESLRRVYWPDAVDEHSVFDGPAEEFIPWVIDTLRGMRATQHNICNLSISIEGQDAWVESYFIAHHKLEDEGGGERDMIAAGRYLDHMQKRGGEWRIRHRRVVYDWDLEQPSTSNWTSLPQSGFMRRGDRAPADEVFRMRETLT
jgi:hypothetical protein